MHRLYFVTIASVSLCTSIRCEAQTATAASPADLWWVGLASAAIGAISALIVPILKDFVIQRLNDRRTKQNTQQEIFRNYAAPLATAGEKLLWRFKEIFIDQRHHFLKSGTLPLVYNEYKRHSTLYRIACLLGWMRAISLELSSLPRGQSGFLTPVASGIAKVQSALADGPHVEVHRLEQMCAVWGLSLEGLDAKRKESLAMEFEVKLYELGGNTLRHDSKHLENLEPSEKTEICRLLSKFLCEKLKRVGLADSIIVETLNTAVSRLAYREALIYRDWQDAIGDLMLEHDPDSVRRFKLIGYERFEDLLKGKALWIEVFRDSIVDIDFDSIDPNDFRAKQLRDLASGVASIILSLSDSDEKDLVDGRLRDIAYELATRS